MNPVILSLSIVIDHLKTPDIMIITLLSHQWKAFWRSRNATRNLAAQLFLGFLILYLSGVALYLGISLKHLLHSLRPDQDLISVFCSLILYFFSMDILLRFMFQELPVLSVQPYLTQNIKKSRLVRFLNIRSLFHFLNLIPFFLFIPFIVTVIAAAKGPLVTACFITGILFLTVFNHFISLFIKRKTIVSSWWFLIFIVVVGGCIALDALGIFSVSKISLALFIPMLVNPWLTLIPVIMGILAFFNNQYFLRQNLYLEEMVKKSRQKQSTEITWLRQWGLSGELAALDIKLILRNKRPRSVLFISILLLFYGFIFYTPQNLAAKNFKMLMFGAFFVTGIFILNYGQFLFAWHSNYFDGLMSSNISMTTFIRSKFLLFISISTLAFVVTSFYGFISWKVLPIQLAAFLYNIGVNTVIATYLATRSYKGIDLAKSATFNYQGTGGTQWLFSMVVILLPMLVVVLIAKFFTPWLSVIVIGSLGLISLLMQNYWIGIIEAGFIERKHTILQGFREK